jgi:hypothetical protein
MTIPDIGHCVGKRSSRLKERYAETETMGVCAACSRRFDLHDGGTLPVQHSIGDDERQGDRRRDEPEQSPAEPDD